MVAVALVLLAGVPGGAEVALAAPPEQEPDCLHSIDLEGKTPEEVLADLKDCLAQSGGIGALGAGMSFTEAITIDKSVTPGKDFYGQGEVVTFTISLANDPGGGLQIFNWTDWLPMVGPCPPVWPAGEFITITTSGTAVGAYGETLDCCDWPTCTMTYTHPYVGGVGWLMGGQSVDINIRYEITECASLFTGNYVEAHDALYMGDWWAAGQYVWDDVGLPLESVRITKTVEPEGRVQPGDLITYTIVVDNYGCDDIRVMMADDLDMASLEGGWEEGWTSGWWGTGVFTGTGSNYLGVGTFYPPGITVTKSAFLYFTGTISSTNVLTLTIPAMVRDTLTDTAVITNTGEFWVWDKWWEDEEPPWWPTSHYYEAVVTNQVGGVRVYLPIILKNYTP
jgi:hypothetical protein